MDWAFIFYRIRGVPGLGSLFPLQIWQDSMYAVSWSAHRKTGTWLGRGKGGNMKFPPRGNLPEGKKRQPKGHLWTSNQKSAILSTSECNWNTAEASLRPLPLTIFLIQNYLLVSFQSKVSLFSDGDHWLAPFVKWCMENISLITQNREFSNILLHIIFLLI